LLYGQRMPEDMLRSLQKRLKILYDSMIAKWRLFVISKDIIGFAYSVAVNYLRKTLYLAILLPPLMFSKYDTV